MSGGAPRGGGRDAGAVDAARLRATLLELCAVPSPSRDERAVADVLRARLEALGASVREDDAARSTGGNAGNLVAELPGGRPERIVLAAHMDTVPLVDAEPLAPEVEGSIVRAGGRQILGSDDKAGVAVVLELVRRAAATPESERPTLVAVFTVCEEVGLQGAQHLDVGGLRADFGYVFDGEVPVGELITSAVFKEALTLTVTGRAAHAALEPERGVHALLAAADVVRAIPLGRVADDQVSNVGWIGGGGPSNVVPAEVVMTGEARAFTRERLEDLIDTMRARAGAAAAARGARLRFERRRLYDGYAIAAGAAPVARLLAAAPSAGLAPRTVASIGGSDTNVLNGKGLPSVNVGLGMHAIHSTEEWIDTADLAAVARWVWSSLAPAGRET